MDSWTTISLEAWAGLDLEAWAALPLDPGGSVPDGVVESGGEFRILTTNALGQILILGD